MSSQGIAAAVPIAAVLSALAPTSAAKHGCTGPAPTYLPSTPSSSSLTFTPSLSFPSLLAPYFVASCVIFRGNIGFLALFVPFSCIILVQMAHLYRDLAF